MPRVKFYEIPPHITRIHFMVSVEASLLCLNQGGSTDLQNVSLNPDAETVLHTGTSSERVVTALSSILIARDLR